MNCEPAGSFGFVHLESPLFGWCGGCVPMSDPDGDGVWSVTVDLAAGNFEYKYAVDGFAGQEDLVDDMQNGASCAPVTDYFSYANRQIDVNGESLGNNLVQNDDFSTSNFWSFSGGWANINQSADLWHQQGDPTSSLTQSGLMVVGETYYLSVGIERNFGSIIIENGSSPIVIDMSTNLYFGTADSGRAYAQFVAEQTDLVFSSNNDIGWFSLFIKS